MPSNRWSKTDPIAMLGFGEAVQIAAGPVGQASSIKMIRSIMVKGLAALIAECVLSARKAGVAGVVLRSLETSHPGFGWPDGGNA